MHCILNNHSRPQYLLPCLLCATIVRMTATFIGIDLAWKSERNPTGAVVLHGDRAGAQLQFMSTPLRSITEVLEFVRTHATEETMLAIDAPLIIGNESGQRGCETLVGK